MAPQLSNSRANRSAFHRLLNFGDVHEEDLFASMMHRSGVLLWHGRLNEEVPGVRGRVGGSVRSQQVNRGYKPYHDTQAIRLQTCQSYVASLAWAHIYEALEQGAAWDRYRVWIAR